MKAQFLINKLQLLVLTTVLVTACATTQEELITDPTIDGATDSGLTSNTEGVEGSGLESSALTETGGGFTQPIAEEILTAQDLLNQTDTMLANRTVYFDFDSAKISDESLVMLEKHGNFVAGNGNVSVRLEGHTDERGSREYNIALGDRRAQSVRRVLLFQGASVDQIDTISYGEEQPAMLGHQEEFWAKNRRVELVYQVN